MIKYYHTVKHSFDIFAGFRDSLDQKYFQLYETRTKIDLNLFSLVWSKLRMLWHHEF